jgi:hypothetical protein
VSRPLTRWLPAPSTRRPARTPWRPQLTQLEDRTPPATFSEAGVTLNLDLAAGEQVGVVANAASYTLTLTGGTWTGSNSFNVTGNGTSTLTVTPFGLLAFTTVNLTDSGAGAGVAFADSGANPYGDNFTVTLDSGSAGVTLTGASAFGVNALSVTTDRNIAVGGGANVSTTGGNLTFSANQQAPATSGNFRGIHIHVTVRASGKTVGLVAEEDDGSGQLDPPQVPS